jgi:hypothetical protein
MVQSVRNRRAELVERILLAATKAAECIESDDCADLVDWCTTVQLRTAELVATAMPDITNRPTFED